MPIWGIFFILINLFLNFILKLISTYFISNSDLFGHVTTRDVTKQRCHAGVNSCHAIGGGVTVLFGHATTSDVTKSVILADLSYGVTILFCYANGWWRDQKVRIGNKIGGGLTLK